MTTYIAHRINTQAELKAVPPEYGVEVDLRDYGNEIILQHDPFIYGESFDTYLESYNHRIIILNIKSEGIEFKVLEILRKHNIHNYFFLDCSFPMIVRLSRMGETNIAIRFSEYESIYNILMTKGMVRWVWVDSFHKFKLEKPQYNIIKDLGLKICIVSPELQQRNTDEIREICDRIQEKGFQIDAICTKQWNIPKWKPITLPPTTL